MASLDVEFGVIEDPYEGKPVMISLSIEEVRQLLKTGRIPEDIVGELQDFIEDHDGR